MSLRPKVGFCNCTVGVSDDDELDRVGDLVLLGPDYLPDGAGWDVQIGRLAGRMRRYVMTSADMRRTFVLGFAVTARCNVVVGTISSDRPLAGVVEATALDFLASERVRGWAEAAVSSS